MSYWARKRVIKKILEECKNGATMKQIQRKAMPEGFSQRAITRIIEEMTGVKLLERIEENGKSTVWKTI